MGSSSSSMDSLDPPARELGKAAADGTTSWMVGWSRGRRDGAEPPPPPSLLHERDQQVKVRARHCWICAGRDRRSTPPARNAVLAGLATRDAVGCRPRGKEPPSRGTMWIGPPSPGSPTARTGWRCHARGEDCAADREPAAPPQIQAPLIPYFCWML